MKKGHTTQHKGQTAQVFIIRKAETLIEAEAYAETIAAGEGLLGIPRGPESIRYRTTMTISDRDFDNLADSLSDRRPELEITNGWVRVEASDGRAFFVDTQGYDYARYTAVEA